MGYQDTTGQYVNGRRNGSWTTYTSRGRLETIQQYKEGSLLWTKDSLQFKREGDSLLALHKKDSDIVNRRTFVKVEIESEFPGGAAGWAQYIHKNLRYPDNAVKNRIQGQVLIGFIVDTIGHIPPTSIVILHSVEYSLDHEALRIIFSSPDWTPAVQNGRKVKSYKRQPITFKFS
jgi:periplasmic protein TonB